MAGMAAIHEVQDVRLLRPCLTLSRDRLRAVLLKLDIAWVEDPSNNDRAYSRVRLRALLPSLAEEGISSVTLSGTVRRMASVRARLEAETAQFLCEFASLYPQGYAQLDRAAFFAADPETARRVLVALLMSLGGNIYPPRQVNLETLYRDLSKDDSKAPRARARTLGNCRIIPKGGDFLICRELGRCEVLAVPPGTSVLWDSRFLVRTPRNNAGAARTFKIGPLGESGWAEIRRQITDFGADFVPKPVLFALPAIRRNGKIVAVPHLKFNKVAGIRDSDVRFIPARQATSAVFPVV
jgi:tRNA(Ile)-lysidine synthase